MRIQPAPVVTARASAPSPAGQVRCATLLTNPRAGRGRAERLHAALLDALARRDVATRTWHAGQPAPDDLGDVLIILGGDGTVHHALPALLASGPERAPAIYHVPAGTENLLARELLSDAHIGTLLRTLDAGRTKPLDVGICEGEPFAIMVGVGADASVIHRVHRARHGRITHLSYVLPILRELVSPCLPRIWLRADGRELVRGEPGVAVVANCRQYGFRLDPCPDARMDDGLLDAVFLPARTSLEGLLWAPRCLTRGHVRHPRCVALRARSIEIGMNLPTAFWQADGEPAGDRSSPEGTRETSTIRCEVRPGAIRALIVPH